MTPKKLLLASIISSLCCSMAFAAGFKSLEQSATLAGQANAGTAVTTDPSIQYYNPAGMAFVTQPEIGLSLIMVDADSTITPIQATGFDGRPITGNADSPSVTNYVPAIYAIKPVDDKFTFGIGLEAPFGLETEYPDDSIARYFAVESKITSINLNPAVAYKPVPWFAVGAGIIFNYTEATLTQAIDGQGILGFPPFLQQPTDVTIDNDASGEALGWDAGIAIKPTTKTEIGLAYHSEIDQDLHGRATFSGDLYTLQQLSTFAGIQNAEVSTSVDLPANVTLSASQMLTPKWTVMGDVEYIDWSSVQDLTLSYVGDSPEIVPSLPSQTLNFGYQDTWRFAIGQSYQAAPDLLLRMGIAYDQTPIRNSILRTARLPDNNRTWIGVGATYDLNKCSEISLGYAHVFIADTTVDNTNGLLSYRANYKGSADLIGLQYNIKFS